MKVQAYSSLESPLEKNQDQTPFTNQGLDVETVLSDTFLRIQF